MGSYADWNDVYLEQIEPVLEYMPEMRVIDPVTKAARNKERIRKKNPRVLSQTPDAIRRRAFRKRMGK